MASPQNQDLDEVRRIVLKHLERQPVQVYLFGSWARGEALENSRSLYPTGLVDLSTVSERFRARVLAEGIPWNG